MPSSFFPILWSCLTGAPCSFILGLGVMIRPSAPRPNTFYDATTRSTSHDGFWRIERSHAMEVPVYRSMTHALEKCLFERIRAGALGAVSDDDFFLFTCDGELTAIVHIVQIEPNCVYFQLRGLEYVQQTICHNGELSVLRQVVLEQRDFGNFGHAIAFMYSMFDLRVKDFPLDMVTVGRYIYEDTVHVVLGNDVYKWYFRALAYVCSKIDEVPMPDDADCPDLDETQTAFVEAVGAGGKSDAIRRLWAMLFGLICVDGHMEHDNLMGIFEGRERVEERFRGLLADAVRLGVVLTLQASVGIAPEGDQGAGEFVEEMRSAPVLPIGDEALFEVVERTEEFVLSMQLVNTYPEIVRFSRSEVQWAVFKMEGQCVKAFWANEARDLLFNSITSNERPGIQFNLPFLRNITNQACNQPIGYPVVVSNVNISLSRD
jgi:hypothetical protein